MQRARVGPLATAKKKGGGAGQKGGLPIDRYPAARCSIKALPSLAGAVGCLGRRRRAAGALRHAGARVQYVN